MKKPLYFVLAMWLALSIAACGAPAATTPPLSSLTATPAVVTFADPALEAMVRGAMGKPEGDITVAEAEAVTRLNLRIEWQRYISQETPIKDIGGLEYFKNLESLDLSFHAITDITPLTGLKKLTSLLLCDNPVADIEPLADLTNLKVLTLSGCAAQDYNPLAKLVNLNVLMLDHAMITDVSPLASLTSLKHLYLAGCPVDYSPLADIYPNLEKKDFIMAVTLAELGFIMDGGNKQANYGGKAVSVNINRPEWGAPPMEWDANCVRMSLDLESGYTIKVGYYAEINAYVLGMGKDGAALMNYVYDVAKGNFSFGMGDRESSEQAMRAALGETDAEDVLLAPIPIFNDTIKSTFGMTADALYALPYAPPTLNNLGFFLDEANAVCVYEQHEPHDMHISIHRPEWGESPDSSNADGANIEFYDHDVNGYNLLILYFADPGRYHIALFKGEEQCAFDSSATGEYGWEYPSQDTVKRMFNGAFGTQGEDFYEKPIAYFEQLLQERFGMSIAALYALPIM